MSMSAIQSIKQNVVWHPYRPKRPKIIHTDIFKDPNGSIMDRIKEIALKLFLEIFLLLSKFIYSNTSR